MLPPVDREFTLRSPPTLEEFQRSDHRLQDVFWWKNKLQDIFGWFMVYRDRGVRCLFNWLTETVLNKFSGTKLISDSSSQAHLQVDALLHRGDVIVPGDLVRIDAVPPCLVVVRRCLAALPDGATSIEGVLCQQEPGRQLVLTQLHSVYSSKLIGRNFGPPAYNKRDQAANHNAFIVTKVQTAPGSHVRASVAHNPSSSDNNSYRFAAGHDSIIAVGQLLAKRWRGRVTASKPRAAASVQVQPVARQSYSALFGDMPNKSGELSLDSCSGPCFRPASLTYFLS